MAKKSVLAIGMLPGRANPSVKRPHPFRLA
jgi:hypothetical protein